MLKFTSCVASVVATGTEISIEPTLDLEPTFTVDVGSSASIYTLTVDAKSEINTSWLSHCVAVSVLVPACDSSTVPF